jgi:hypothetical protein
MGKGGLNCSLVHIESLVRSREVRIQRREQQARAHIFMEGARQVGVSVICVECIC